MPRGLGDDPLTRGKKVKRAAQTAAPESAEPDSGTPQSPDSYNDVFFQRRSEDVPPAVGPVVPAAAQAEATSGLQSPSPILEVAPEVAPPPTEVPAMGQQPGQPASQEHAQTSAQAAPTQDQPQKAGFFGRIFGKLRK